jgi:hypothetical protein
VSAEAGAPRFAVVGRVNKGKSSIVSTLAEDESVAIDPRPGTTTHVREFPVAVDGRPLFVLLDTPGFEDAPRALAWLRARDVSAAERPARVAELVRAHEGTEEFVEERRLLQPILDGASVLYVVDGTKPYRRNYEAEMEILRWTGRPGMALVNRIGDEDHSAEWRRALGQYFGIVRDFDAFSVTFEERLHLLTAFRELRPDLRAAFDDAVAALSAQRRRRRDDAAGILARLLAGALTHCEEIVAADEAELEAQRARIERAFHDELRAMEEKARRRVEALYGHSWTSSEAAAGAEAEIIRPVLKEDLFAEETWRLLGLSAGQLVAASAIAGAAIGGTVDVFLGGASVMAGTVLGGAAGAGTAIYGLTSRFARVRRIGPGGLAGALLHAQRTWSGERRFRIGPHAGPNFPWVLLDRSLLHYDAVARRTHARRGALAQPSGERPGLVTGFAREERGELTRLFAALRREFQDPPRELEDELARALERILRRVDPVPGDPT